MSEDKKHFHAFVKGVYQATMDNAARFDDGEIDYKAFYKVVTEELLKRERPADGNQ